MVALPLVFGLLVGSFLNVVIARVPEGRSVWAPRSACPRCGALIGWYDNIPLVSFLVLRGRCRGCRAGIAWRYPIVEAATGGVFALAYVLLGPTPEFLVAAVLLGALIAITAIDLRHQIIPDVISLPGIVVGFVANSLLPGGGGWLDSLIGIAVGGGLFLVIILVSGGGMGGGDMKLGAMLGAFLGWKLGLLALLLGVLAGGAVAVVLLLLGRKGRKDAIPFGPYLALGGAVALLWGDRVLTWYLSRF
jgi:leader peptidase (prepilin peptidase) / N-methyltransferase